MLDDLKYIHERDAQDALGIAEKQWQQFQQTYDTTAIPDGITTDVVVAGMGGSGLAAMFLPVWPGISVPYAVSKGYDLPAHVNKNTLLICSSYSGNTEETLSALEQGEAKGAQIVVVASGGKLAEAAKAKNYPWLALPTGFQPRMTLGYQLSALVQILEAAGHINGKTPELQKAAEWLKSQTAGWRPDVAAKDNLSKQIAQELMGKSPVIYAGPKLFPAAYKWKISFNENAKNVAWCNAVPEFNHNEFLGWTSHPTDKPYAVIDLRSNLEHERVQKRFEVSERLLSGKRPSPEVVNAEGTDIIEQLLWTVALGDFVSLYLALLNGLNPTPVDLIEKFKSAMND